MRNFMEIKPEFNSSYKRLAGAVCAVLLIFCCVLAAVPADADITVTVAGPGGRRSQTLPDSGGAFDMNLPLNRNAVNDITVTAEDASGNTASRTLSVTQVSLDQIVVSQVTAERLSVEEVEQLVSDGVIDLEDPENYNVSTFDIVLTIGDRPVPVSLPIAVPVEEPEPIGFETLKMPAGGNDTGSIPTPPPVQIVVFEQHIAPSGPGQPAPPPIPGVIIIEGNIKSLKEFFNVRLLLMNTSGIFTLSDVTAEIVLPEGALSTVLPLGGINPFGDILPGNSDTPGQKEKEFIIRGDAIGLHDITVNFGGTVTGPGIDEPIAFNGSAETQVEVKGPPTFLVEVTHPDVVTAGVPYELQVDITNTGDLTAMYASLELGTGGDADVESCSIGTEGEPVCTYTSGPEIRPFGHIEPGETVRETFTLLPSADGAITSCVAASDQNITLNVYMGSQGCMVGHYPPKRSTADGIPAVSVVPAPNTTGVHTDTAVTAFFSEQMHTGTIRTGEGGTFNVFNSAGDRVAGILRFDTLFENTDKAKTIAIWQVNDGDTNRLAPNAQYTVIATTGIRDLEGNSLANRWESTFTTTGAGIDDTTPPSVSMSVVPPVNPNAVQPGEIVNINAYAADAGSGISRVEMRLKDLDVAGSSYVLIGQKTVFEGDQPPFIFSIDSAQLEPGHIYQALATAYDGMNNSQDGTLSLVITAASDPPTISLPADLPDTVLQGISITIRPQVSAGVRKVSYFLDAAIQPHKTVTLAPFQTSLSTLTLDMGVHTVILTGTDGLGREVQTVHSFTVLENPNAPVVGFTGVTNGATYISGASIRITGMAEDSVGIAEISYYLDDAETTPLYSGFAPILLNTTGIANGDHVVYIKATNTLGVSSDPADPGAAFAFTIADPPPGEPPAAPVFTQISFAEEGMVSVSGTAEPGARIDVTNATLGITVSLYADNASHFSGQVPGETGNELTAVAYLFSQSPDPSVSATGSVPAAPVLDHITVNPAVMTFTAAGEYADITVTGYYQSGDTADLTAQAVYASSNPSVATVNSSGRVAALAHGTAAISATFGGHTAQVSVTANIVTLTSLTVSPAAVQLVYPGQIAALSVTGNYSDGTSGTLSESVTFISGNPAVVTVGADGMVTAVSDGSTHISVSVPGVPAASATITVDASANAAPQINVLNAPDNAEPGEGIPVHVEASDDLGVQRIDITLTAGAEILDAEIRTFGSDATPVTADVTLTIPDTLLPGTSVTVVAEAFDAGGNTGTQTTAVAVVDLAVPQVQITAPADGQLFNPGDFVTITIHAADAVGVETVGYTATGAFETSEGRTLLPAPEQSETFGFAIPDGTAGDIVIQAEAVDTVGNRGASTTVTIEVVGDDITPPETLVTGITATGDPAAVDVHYSVLNGLWDTDYIALYFRRDGIGTFNRYTISSSAEPEEQAGIFHPDAVDGTIRFVATDMGGNGSYEFYTVGVDLAGNVEDAPDPADRTTGIDDPGYSVTTLTSDQTLTAGDTSLDGLNLVVDNAVLTVDGTHVFGNVTLLNGAVFQHSATSTTYEAGVELTVRTLAIDAFSRIDLTGLGYLGGRRGDNGDSRGRTLNNDFGAVIDVGGSYGGLGASASDTAIYGAALAPFELGSGGGAGDSGSGYPGGTGGGRIRITAVNVMADGDILSDGTVGSGAWSGAGSGGAIQIATATLSGSGMISANGGSQENSGGGGRIAVGYVDMLTFDPEQIQALGGSANNYGGDGTVVLKGPGETYGSLVIDANGLPGPGTASRIAGGTYDHITLRNGARVTADDPVVVTGTLRLENNSVLTHSNATLETVHFLDLTVHTLDIDDTSAIDVSGKGYLGGRQGANSGDYHGRTLGNLSYNTTDTAGSYGGRGHWSSGAGSNPPYGDISEPGEAGSGGGAGDTGSGYPGGTGGGRVKINANVINLEGAIRSNGKVGSGAWAGAGSGGAVNIRTGTLAGSGVVQANGGSRENSGGGGRIAVRFTNMADFDDQNLQAFGGMANNAGGPGTIYLEGPETPNGTVIFDGGGFDYHAYWWSSAFLPTAGPRTSTDLVYDPATDTTVLLDADNDIQFLPDAFRGLYLAPDAHGDPDERFEIVANTENSIRVQGDMTPAGAPGDVYVIAYRFDALLVRDGAVLSLCDRLEADQGVRLENNGTLSHLAATAFHEPWLWITTADMEIDNTSRIDVTGRGYLGGRRGDNADSRGLTIDNVFGAAIDLGGSYGGLGAGAPADALYGDSFDPFELGSGGGAGDSSSGYPGGTGGGRVRIVADTLLLDGEILSNGTLGGGAWSGAGSGGAVNISIGILSGGGWIRANGGSQENSGGGGRIVVRYDDMDAFGSSRIQALGGGANNYGGDGTVILKGPGETYGSLIIDGNGLVGPEMASRVSGGTYDNITLRNGARATADDPVTVTGTLRLENNTVLTHSYATLTQIFGMHLDVDTLVIDATSAIDVSGKGYLGGRRGANSGDYHGRTLGNLPFNTTRTAGSYGGRGHWTNGAGSNLPYAGIDDPYDLGSGGGAGDSGSGYPGGNGGGRIKIIADTIDLDGVIRSNGTRGAGAWAGAGSGGAVNIETVTLSGGGVVQANGGSQENSGGGGRVALRYTDMSGFDIENLQAFGGTANYAGGPGTIYREGPETSGGELIVDGGGCNYDTYWWSAALLPTAGPRTSSGLVYDPATGTTELVDADIDVDFLPNAFTGLYLTPDVFGDEDAPFEILANTENRIVVQGDMTGVATPGDTYALAYRFDRVHVRNGAVLCVNDLLAADQALVIETNGVLSHLAATTQYEPWLWVTAGDIQVDASSRIDVSGRGYLGGRRGDNGDSRGLTLGNIFGAAIDVGGSYGGIGAGASSGDTYGNPFAPFELGSGGGAGDAGSGYPGGTGGGRIRLVADSILLDGAIQSNGTLSAGAWAGAGSGGAVNISAGALTGSGTVRANGGSRENSGGGGRIAVLLGSEIDPEISVIASGGVANNPGTDGSVEFSYE